MFIFACAGSSLLHGLFSRCGEWVLLSCFGAWALGLEASGSVVVAMGLVVPWHVGSSPIRDRSHVSCSSSQILYH